MLGDVVLFLFYFIDGFVSIGDQVVVIVVLIMVFDVMVFFKVFDIMCRKYRVCEGVLIFLVCVLRMDIRLVVGGMIIL